MWFHEMIQIILVRQKEQQELPGGEWGETREDVLANESELSQSLYTDYVIKEEVSPIAQHNHKKDTRGNDS